MKMLKASVLVFAVMFLATASARAPRRRWISCPRGWTNVRGRCFYYVSTMLPWAKAEQYCQTLGANLASVHNAYEYRRIQRLIWWKTHAYGRTWLGGSDCQKEGVWLWTDGTSFSYRHCGRFDNLFWVQHCLQMNYGAYRCWDDTRCSNNLPFVCAKKPPGV
ncbi:galactose-specific lectin nattectin-like [Chaetodon auriga]|uniref:galactose-specific lectin nattectin-like n=1 Tax=Chaetodon auriga TaxID=39042 RepID=UPI004032DBE6